MRDIAGAIAAEQQYIQDRIYNHLTVNIYDYLLPYGYVNLNDYFRDKHYYQLAHCGVVQHECTPQSAIPEIQTYMANGTPGLWIPESNHIFAWGCQDEKVNRALFAEYDIPVYDVPALGGAMISGPEDIGVCVIIPSSIGVGTNHILNRLLEFFSSRADENNIFVRDGNDILYNGKKIIGVTQNNLDNGMFVFWGHVSIVDRADLVYAICPPTGAKAPGFIGNLFTRAELINEIKCWFGLGDVYLWQH